MAEVRPFHGIRYRGRAASVLGQLLAPPYDVLPTGDPAIVNAFNIGRLEAIDPALEPGDSPDPHQRAADRLRRWRASGVLATDDVPALYLHEHTFWFDGRRLTRRALLGRVRLAPWGDREVLPHERTFPAAVSERLARLRAVEVDLSPIYLLAPDADGALRDLLAAQAEAQAPTMTGRDGAGDDHRLTMVADPAFAERVGQVMARRQLLVADGHHRYEAALAYRDEERRRLAATSVGPAAGVAPADFVLALIAPMGDEGVCVRPTHRLVRGLKPFDPTAARARIVRWFDLADEPIDGAASPIADPNVLCRLVVAGASTAWRLTPRADAAHAAQMPVDRSPAWRSMPVAIVEQIVFQELLGVTTDDPRGHVLATTDAASAIAEVGANQAQLAVVLPTPSLPAIVAVANLGEPLPPKATAFVPKAPAGLVMYEVGSSQ